jgi:hypothetical protein
VAYRVEGVFLIYLPAGLADDGVPFNFPIKVVRLHLSQHWVSVASHVWWLLMNMAGALGSTKPDSATWCR